MMGTSSTDERTGWGATPTMEADVLMYVTVYSCRAESLGADQMVAEPMNGLDRVAKQDGWC